MVSPTNISLWTPFYPTSFLDPLVANGLVGIFLGLSSQVSEFPSHIAPSTLRNDGSSPSSVVLQGSSLMLNNISRPKSTSIHSHKYALPRRHQGRMEEERAC